jgi:hypothetical protein
VEFFPKKLWGLPEMPIILQTLVWMAPIARLAPGQGPDQTATQTGRATSSV